MMEADFPDPVKHLDDCILTQHPDCDFIENCEVRCTQPNCFWISDPQKLCLRLWATKFETICYIIIDNKHGLSSMYSVNIDLKN